MKICYIASPSVHTNRWLQYFADRGHEVHLITSSRPSGDSINNVKLHWLKRFGPQIRPINYLINSLPLIFQFKRLVKNIDPGIIHAHSIMDTTLLGAVSRFHPFVVTPWGSDILITPQKSRLSKWMAEYILKRADLITCDGEHVKKPLIALRADPEKIKIVYFGVDTQKFKPGPGNKRLKKELGILNSPTVISLRRLEPIYDVESLIRAVPLVLKEVPEAKFLLMEKGSEEARLKLLASSLGISDSVKFIGRAPHHELPNYLTLAHVYVSTSLSDTTSVSLLEAMACELPVVVTGSGDNRNWVQSGQNGFIVPVKSPRLLADRIIYLLNKKELREKMGKANRQLVKEQASYEKEMHKMLGLYNGLVGRRK